MMASLARFRVVVLQVDPASTEPQAQTLNPELLGRIFELFTQCSLNDLAARAR